MWDRSQETIRKWHSWSPLFFKGSEKREHSFALFVEVVQRLSCLEVPQKTPTKNENKKITAKPQAVTAHHHYDPISNWHMWVFQTLLRLVLAPENQLYLESRIGFWKVTQVSVWSIPTLLTAGCWELECLWIKLFGKPICKRKKERGN